MGGGSSFSNLIQQAIAGLPYNMQHYVGGPSYPGMQQPADRTAGMNTGSYNQLTQNMRGMPAGSPANFSGGGFGYMPTGNAPPMQNPYRQSTGWQPMPQTMPMRGPMRMRY